MRCRSNVQRLAPAPGVTHKARLLHYVQVFGDRLTSHLEPSVSLVMDIGPSPQRRATSRRRISSPNAAKTGAVDVFALGRMFQVPLEILHLHAPTLLVRGERFRPATSMDLLEA